LNLDADLELGARGNAYTPSRSVLEAMRRVRASLASRLLGPGDIIVDETSSRGSARGRLGRAFCPTPRAIAILERAGATPEPFPSVDILRRVNGRAFSAALGTTLPRAVFAPDEEAAEAVLATEPPEGFRAWHVKSAFGMAGRGHRVLAPARTRERNKADRDFLVAAFRDGHGAMVEPHAEIEVELAIHGVLARDGSLRLGAITKQRVDARGAWIASEPLDENASETFAWADALEAEARRVADALRAAGYFGPFGVDAFTYRLAGQLPGEARFNPRSEINARYSMGFPEGMRLPRVVRCGP